jgi:hypothetical protein
MYLEHAVHAVAGTFILLSLVLSQFYSPYWLFFTAFVGVNLFQHAFTKWCLMEKILAKAGLKSYAEAKNKAGCDV